MKHSDPLSVAFELLLAESRGTRATRLAGALATTPAPELAEFLDLLEPHKVLPLLALRLRTLGVLAQLPPGLAERLTRAQARARELNQHLFLAAARILLAARQRGLQPLLLKGLLFADSYYPDPSTRPMGDLDLVAPPGLEALLHVTLEQVGFTRRAKSVEQAHAALFVDERGVACDAHGYLEMYPDASWSELARSVELKRLHGVRVAALEPNVMLAHLIDHMHGHSHDLGLVLLWLLDVAFVLRRHAAELDAIALRRWLPAPGAWALALRIFALLELHGEPLPAGLYSLRPAFARLPPLTLEAVLRVRRTAPWGLPAPLGFLRLLAYRLALRDYAHRTPPQLADLCLLPFDRLSDRLSVRLARLRD